MPNAERRHDKQARIDNDARLSRASGESTNLDELQELLGVQVDPTLLTLALTHRSYAYEHGGIPNNERLEFLGDSILGQAVTVKLYRENPRTDEGGLAKRRASLVSSVALAEVARTIGLGRFLLLGRGESQSGGADKSSILADTVEAIIGAVYLDAGGEVATALVLRLIEPLLDDPDRFGAALDPKTSLQELAARHSSAPPRYEVTDSGPDHNKTFHATVTVDGLVSASGEGSSKKNAEMAAALQAWSTVNERGSRARASRG
ncbi:ribonuclease III [Humibacter ginsenosidimutans]|uniref:Ribonuclease 3 n=1 Tax=Humibacter ginsenosidimutans TaxID=2599293 RepID=A0A5B8M0C8_9MICO|nr:ribonuclease III [Humibacter ginsenosidimutans]QDZ14107.1 ribonuclease III [Humibacter ginsenosidimutans]